MYLRPETDRQIYRHEDHNTSHPCRGRSNYTGVDRIFDGDSCPEQRKVDVLWAKQDVYFTFQSSTFYSWWLNVQNGQEERKFDHERTMEFTSKQD